MFLMVITKNYPSEVSQYCFGFDHGEERLEGECCVVNLGSSSSSSSTGSSSSSSSSMSNRISIRIGIEY